MKRYIPVLTIAGSDPSGGAGIQADIKTITSTGCYAMSVITALTVQNTVGVATSMTVPADTVAAQLNAVLDDITPAAIKIGMIASADNAHAVADILATRAAGIPLVVDPVMVSTSGHRLIDAEAEAIVRNELLPLATVITPNVSELEALTPEVGENATVDSRLEALRAAGIKSILVTGGDTDSTEGYATDLLLLPDDPVNDLLTLRADRVNTANTHGTGCTLSAAIASFLALGFPLIDAVKAAKSYITRALIAGADVALGHGHGPVNHTFGPRRTRFLDHKTGSKR
ncbi:MAG: bifunctional hydroxymethylpyrimidine kinase/phosphomethylpyrimidine kinase [Muribaculaceae bacterium]|nr:bifunctional hydroxymethylpyrimidine kinase/phosphomethylpyrimidine kinase [Muribaculaceae bacterium]